jgi:hypothetical protein
MALAGKPGQAFIIPDPAFQGRASLYSATSEAGPSPGAAVPDADLVFGSLVPLQSGELDDAVVPVTYSIQDAGGPGNATFLWRRATEASPSDRGVDDVRRFWGYHGPRGTNTVDNNACCWSSFLGKWVVGLVNRTSSSLQTYVRHPDDDWYDTWTSLGSIFLSTRGGTINSNDHGLQMIELSDGRILFVFRVTPRSYGALAVDFDVYMSANGGLTIYPVALDILRSAGVAAFTHEDCQFRLARAGEWIRLCVADTSGDLHTFLSTDFGLTWKEIAEKTGILGSTGGTDDVRPFALVGIDDAGTFMLTSRNTATGTTTNHYQATQDGVWTEITGSGIVQPANVRQIVLVNTGTWLYEFVWWSDGTTGQDDGWNLRRVRCEDFAADVFLAWEEIPTQQMSAFLDTAYNPLRTSAAWNGSEILFFSGLATTGGLELDTATAWYWGGWSTRTLGDFQTKIDLDSQTGSIFDIYWCVAFGAPDDPVSTSWTKVTSGTGADALTPGHDLILTATTATSTVYYEWSVAAASVANPEFGISEAACFSWIMRLDTGDGDVANDNVGARFISTDATGGIAHVDVSVRIATGGQLRLRDNVGGVDQDTAIDLDTGASGTYLEFRLWFAPDSPANCDMRVAVYNLGTRVWTVGAATTAAFGGGVANTVVRFGHLGQTQATQMRSWWREFGMGIHDTTLSQEGFSTFGGNQERFGAVADAFPVRVEQGLYVQWAGGAGAHTDTYTGAIDHQYPAEALFVDSPQIGWRSTSVANNTLIFIANQGQDEGLFWHDAVAVFGSNNRNVRIDYDDNVNFSSPNNVMDVNLDLWSGDVDLVDAASITLDLASATTPVVAGQFTGCYIRVLTGGAAGETFKITDHAQNTSGPSRAVLVCGDLEDPLSSYGLVSGDTIAIFGGSGADFGVATIGYKYMRVRFLDTTTAEGYHTLGTIVAGNKVSIDVPIDWAITDDMQPNVTTIRARSGIAWAYEESPPQRTITGRLVGDNQRWREMFRHMLRRVGLERRAIALVLDDEDMVGPKVMLGRVKNGAALDNAAYYRHADDNSIHPMGDMSLVFVEEA